MNIPEPIPFKFKGKIISFQPFTVKDHLQLAAYMRDAYMTEAKKQLTGLPFELQKYAWSEAKQYSDNLQPGRTEYDKAFATPDSIAYAFYLQLQKTMPDISLDDCMEFMSENAELVEKIGKAVGYESPDPLAETATEVTEPPLKG